MLPPSKRFFLRLIAGLLVAGCGVFLVWVNHGRQQRVEFVTGLAGPIAANGAATASGYPQEQRNLIVPERLEESFDWIAQTQQMLARREWRVRQVDYENAPYGRPVNTASPYRWWLGFVAWLEPRNPGTSGGLAVEQAALRADPLLHGLLLAGAAVFVAWRFGLLAATLLAAGLVGLFPLSAAFLPGAPSDRGLLLACNLAGQLMLLAGLRAPGRASRWFALAGVAGGLGLWLDVTTQVPLLAGTGLGALLMAGSTRNREQNVPEAFAPPWRTWAFSGATTVLAAYLAEFFPGHWRSLDLGSVHPLYGLAWMGAGELLVAGEAWMRGKKPLGQSAGLIRIFLAVLALASVPLVMQATGSHGFLSVRPDSDRLTNLPNGVVAASLPAWLERDGLTGSAGAALLPLLLLLPAGWQWLRRRPDRATCAPLAWAFGPVLVALGLASQRLDWWSLLDGAWLILLVAAVTDVEFPGPGPRRLLWAALVGLAIIPGVMQVWPDKRTGAETLLTGREAQQLIERHLAQWLVRRAGETGVVVYAAPREMAALSYYGGLRGLGSFARENQDGLAATHVIARAATMAKAHELLQAREARFLVFPSWDPFFNPYLQKPAEGAGRVIADLQIWHLPSWLRPLPYKGIMDQIGGFEGETVRVFELVEEQPPSLAACRLAEYLVETGRTDQLQTVAAVLRNYPGDLGVLVALMQVQVARKDFPAAQALLAQVEARLAVGADRALAWDRRVSLAILLAQAKRPELARAQASRCLAEMNPRRLRTLTDGSLYNWQVLVHLLGLEWPDPKLHELSLELLPPEARARLQVFFQNAAPR